MNLMRSYLSRKAKNLTVPLRERKNKTVLNSEGERIAIGSMNIYSYTKM